MTRKKAIKEAINALSGDKRYEEVVGRLQDIYDELPLTHWSDQSIRDCVETFIEENGRFPTATDFRKKGMPPHTVIEQKYKLSLSKWLIQNNWCHHKAADEVKDTYTKAFVDEYERLRPATAKAFNQRRAAEVKSWQTIANHWGVQSWRKLLEVLGLPYYGTGKREGQSVSISVKIHSDYDLREESKG